MPSAAIGPTYYAELTVAACACHGRFAASVPLDGSDLVYPQHRAPFAAAQRLAAAGTRPDPVGVADALRAEGKADALGGLAGILDLAGHADHVEAEELEQHAWRVKGEARKRRAQASLVAAARARADDVDLNAQAAADLEDLRAAARRDAFRLAPDVVDEILARAADPWVSLALDGRELVALRLGAVAALMGGPGAGKTTLSAAILEEHARAGGLSIYVSLELDHDELVARIVGLRCGAAWRDVLQGRVPREDMVEALSPRFASCRALADLEATVARLRAQHGDAPVLVAVDYLQIAAAPGPDVRISVATVMEQIRTLAKRLRLLVLVLSQTSRAAARALRAGELVGVESMTAGAESSAIERWAYLTLALGTMGPEREDGTHAVELSVGKSRFGQGDRVIPLAYHGRAGRWRIVGESRSASEVQAERQGEREQGRVQAAKLAMLALADRARAPVTREDLRGAAATSRAVAWAAIGALLDEGALVECDRVPHSRYRKLWTPDRLRARADSRTRGEA